MPSVSERVRGEGSADLRRYLRAIWRRKWAVLAVLAVTVGTAHTFTAFQAPYYRAIATVLIEPELPKIANVQDPLPRLGSGDDYYATQYKLIQGRPVVEAVMQRLKVKERMPWAGSYERFVRQIWIEPVRNTRLVLVSFYDGDPFRAAEMANGLASEYVRSNLELKHKASQEALVWLNEQLTTLKTQTQQSSKALQAYQAHADLLGIQEQRQIAQSKIVDVTRMYLDAQSQRLTIEAKLRELSRAVQDPKAAETIFTVADDPMIRKLRTEASDLQMERTKLSQLYKEKHPDFQLVDAQIKQVNQRLHAEMQKLLRAVETEHKVAKTREETLLASVNELRSESRRLNERETQAVGLQREKESTEDLYSTVLKRLKETGVATGLETNNVRLVEAATPPPHPAGPNKPLIHTLSVVAGLALGIGMSLLAESLDNRVRSAEDVERAVGLPVLAVVPVFKRQPSAAKGSLAGRRA